MYFDNVLFFITFIDSPIFLLFFRFFLILHWPNEELEKMANIVQSAIVYFDTLCFPIKLDKYALRYCNEKFRGQQVVLPLHIGILGTLVSSLIRLLLTLLDTFHNIYIVLMYLTIAFYMAWSDIECLRVVDSSNVWGLLNSLYFFIICKPRKISTSVIFLGLSDRIKST